MKTLLEVHDVKKAYRMGKVLVPASCGVSFDVKESKFLTIFGPSGSGKSTLLHLMGARKAVKLNLVEALRYE